MVSIEFTEAGYNGIPATEDALTQEEIILLADTQDAHLINHLIAMIKSLKGWE